MKNSKTQKILNLLTATVVLVGGFYILIFFPTTLSGLARILIGVLLIVYFLFRVRQSTREVKSELGGDYRNKPLDK